jgi:hypothetical protein
LLPKRAIQSKQIGEETDLVVILIIPTVGETAFPQSKTPKDLKEQPRELQGIMCTTNSTLGIKGWVFIRAVREEEIYVPAYR